MSTSNFVESIDIPEQALIVLDATQPEAQYKAALYTAGVVAANLIRDRLNGQETSVNTTEVALDLLKIIQGTTNLQRMER